MFRFINGLPMFYMDADTGASGGAAGDKTTTTQGEPAPAQPNGANGGQQQDDPNNPRWLPDRLEKAKSSAIKQLLDGIGAKDADELSNLVKLAREYEQSKLTESEKTTKQITDLTTDRDSWKSKYEAELDRANKIEQSRIADRVENALKLAVKDAGAKRPDDVLVLLNTKHGEKVSKLANDKGEIDSNALSALVDEFRKASPEYFGATGGPGSPSNRGGKAPDPSKDALKRASLSTQLSIRRGG